MRTGGVKLICGVCSLAVLVAFSVLNADRWGETRHRLGGEQDNPSFSVLNADRWGETEAVIA